MDPESLVEDGDVFSGHFEGQLSFKDDNKSGSMKESTEEENLHFEDNDKLLQAGPANLAFEVVNAQVIKDVHDKYVLYSVLLVSHPGMDKTPVTVDRRYSDFDRLNTQLRKRFPGHLKDIAFPKKVLVGNFKAATVAQRSRAFEQYLTHLFSIDEIRLSPEFGEFFYNADLMKGYEHIYNGQYDEAIPLLENVLNIEKKILGCKHKHVILTLCALLACHHAMEREKPAQILAETILLCIGDNDAHPYLIPLLNLSINLCWKLGKQKADLEERLFKLKEAGCDVNNVPSLLELVVRRFQPK